MQSYQVLFPYQFLVKKYKLFVLRKLYRKWLLSAAFQGRAACLK